MKNFCEWYADKNREHKKFFIEQGRPNYDELPKPVQIPPNSGNFYYVVPDPDEDGKYKYINTRDPDSRKVAIGLMQRSKPSKTNEPSASAPVTKNSIASLINPHLKGNKVDIGDGQIISMENRNAMIKKIISRKLGKSYYDLNDTECDMEIAVLANENDQTHFLTMGGKREDLRAIQEKFVNQYGVNPEMQLINGATKSMTRLTPKNWTGIRVKISKLGTRQALPQGAVLVNIAGQPVDRTGKLIPTTEIGETLPIGTPKNMPGDPAQKSSEPQDIESKSKIPGLPEPTTKPTPPASESKPEPTWTNNPPKPMPKPTPPVPEQKPKPAPTNSANKSNWQEVKSILDRLTDLGEENLSPEEKNKIFQFAKENNILLKDFNDAHNLMQLWTIIDGKSKAK